MLNLSFQSVEEHLLHLQRPDIRPGLTAVRAEGGCGGGGQGGVLPQEALSIGAPPPRGTAWHPRGARVEALWTSPT